MMQGARTLYVVIVINLPWVACQVRHIHSLIAMGCSAVVSCLYAKWSNLVFVNK